jgi:monoamine oxidase
MQYLVWKINRMARTVPLRNPGSCKNAIYWDSITVYSWIHQNVWFEKVKKLVEAAVRAVFGVEPS